MTAELVRGQNHPLPQARLEVRVSAGTPIVAGATLGDEQGKVRGVEWVAHPGAPTLPGLEVSKQAAADHRLAFDLDALPGTVHRVHVLLALPTGGGGPARFGAVAAPFVAVTGLDGAEIASYTITGLNAESAVVALELYRRQDAWKVRAVGQGYAGGLAELFADQGLPQAQQLAAGINEAVAQGLARSVAAPPRLPDGERTPPAASAPGSDQTHARPVSQGAAQVAADHVQPHQGTPGRPQPGSPYDGAGPQSGAAPQPDHAAGRSVPQEGHPGAPVRPDSAAARPATPGAGGPIDYSHPARQNVAPPPPPPPAAPGHSAQPVAGDATGWTMEERLYNQVWGMFEDLARATAAYRSAVDFADSRREQELDKALSDPRSRIGGQGDAVREAAQAKHAQLVDQARAALDRDLAQLMAESDVVEPALPRLTRAGTIRSGTATGCRWRPPWPCAWAISTSRRAKDCASPCWSGCRWSAVCGSTAAAPDPVTARSPTPTSCAASPWTRRWRMPRGCSPSIRRASSPCTSSTRPARAPPRSRP
ncbi:hypothetical protein SAV31267_027410 [Streptomyces avermitilis]|uniref:TerD domain-containing protein n=1 Tax=Streptomyces avermitilis TaxID=33903 RepID=A0A4D4MNB2_STRAX|nr:hypothetical protein SAV31267_027410 [Streptomyces avermitilis]